MTYEMKLAWVRALQSGDYRHDRIFLKVRHVNGAPSYSPFGVLYELAGWRWHGPALSGQYSVMRPEDRVYPESMSILPERFRAEIGLDDRAYFALTKALLAGASQQQFALKVAELV